MHEESRKTAWVNLKALLIARFQTVNRAAEVFDCSPRGLRAAAEGKCPGILQKLRAAGIFDNQPPPQHTT